MANKLANVKATITYVDPDGSTVTVPQVTLACPYQGQLHGAIDVADAAAAGTFPVPFGPVGKATAALIENKLGQPVDISINGGDLAYTGLASGQAVLLAFPATPDDAVTSIDVITNDPQTGDASIAFHLWGDPT